jgi:predicted dehydrogenase
MYERFIRAIRTGKQGQTSFAGAARVQAYLDASFRSDVAGKAIKIR